MAAALALAGSAGAQAQEVYVAEPAPAYINPAPYYSPAPPPVVAAPPVVVTPPAVVVAPPAVVAPGPDLAYVPPPAGATVVNPRTGRTCTIEPSGYRWCWTP
jgi:hypothetical protein